MQQTTTKPIRSTRVIFESSDAKQQFEDYATQPRKTESVGMDRMRQLIRDHKDKRK